MCTCMHVHTWICAPCTHGGQRITSGRWFSSVTIWVLGTKLQSSDLTPSLPEPPPHLQWTSLMWCWHSWSCNPFWASMPRCDLKKFLTAYFASFWTLISPYSQTQKLKHYGLTHFHKDPMLTLSRTFFATTPSLYSLHTELMDDHIQDSLEMYLQSLSSLFFTFDLVWKVKS